MSSQYTGITIGPIASTMELTSSPAGLWGASSLFSWIAAELIQELLCNEIRPDGITPDAFVSPWFTLNDKMKVVLSDPMNLDDGICEEMREKGVGMFHDRIIFRSDDVENPLELIRKAVEKVIDTLAINLGMSAPENETKEVRKAWLRDYLCIHAITAEVPNSAGPLVYLGRRLGAIELETNFPVVETENPLLRQFENVSILEDSHLKHEEGRNALMRRFFLTPSANGWRNWILSNPDKPDSIRDLKHISALGKNATRKYQQYYAVLKSDGDSMSELLNAMTPGVYKDDVDNVIRDYSRKCLLFCARASDLIQKYGGMPIFAGGDDLLALVPTVGNYLPGKQDNPEDRKKRRCSITCLVERLRNLFNDIFEQEREQHGGNPTISFGISIQFEKSPLYEALEQAEAMLMQAKRGPKNACCLHLQKHSGQSVLIVEEEMDHRDNMENIDNRQNLFARLETLFQLTDTDDGKCEQSNDESTLAFLSGAGYQVEQFHTLFYEAIKYPDRRSEILNNLFRNLFDSQEQEQFGNYLEQLKACAEQIMNDSVKETTEDNESYCNRIMVQIQSVIRLVRFYREKKEVEK